MKKYIIALDQGTTSSRAILFNHKGELCGLAQSDFPQYFPKPGWVEHDPKEILSSQFKVLTELLVSKGLSIEEIDSIGITNQRETTIVWDRYTGEPVYNAIVWQCRRTTDLIEDLCGSPEIREEISQRTGLIPDAYYSASKIAWILNEVPGVRERAEAGDLLFGTVDSWLIWQLTDHSVHATDPTNASRTMLFNIHTGEWDSWLCKLFNIPMNMLPEVRTSSGTFGTMKHQVIAGEIPICGVAGDQQAALFGQCCFNPGEVKSTFGTGCFLLMNTGENAAHSTHGLVTTIAASAPGTSHYEYALEGSVFMAGALIQWLKEGLHLIEDVAETDQIARSVSDSAGVVIVPAFTGLGAPYWDAEARGAIYGLTRGVERAHIVRACLEACGYQVYDVLKGMQADSNLDVVHLNVDGGACKNNFILEFCADILNVQIRRPNCVETTAKGAAFLAGLSTGFWENLDELRELHSFECVTNPQMEEACREQLLAKWKDAVSRTSSVR